MPLSISNFGSVSILRAAFGVEGRLERLELVVHAAAVVGRDRVGVGALDGLGRAVRRVRVDARLAGAHDPRPRAEPRLLDRADDLAGRASIVMPAGTSPSPTPFGVAHTISEPSPPVTYCRIDSPSSRHGPGSESRSTCSLSLMVNGGHSASSVVSSSSTTCSVTT
jgi:hypothetical protein